MTNDVGSAFSIQHSAFSVQRSAFSIDPNPMITNPQQLELPERIRRLAELATDLWWTWNTQAREVFRRLDYPLWRQTAHNPVLMLRNVAPELLTIVARDPEFLRVYDAAIDALDRARAAHDTWWQRHYGSS